MNELLGNNILDLRKKNKMSQEHLANLLNVSRQSISKWERGESYPDIANLKKLSQIFNVSIDDLVDYEFKVEEVKPVKQMPGDNVDQSLISISLLGLTIIEIIQYIITIAGILAFNGVFNNFEFSSTMAGINVPFKYITTVIYIQAVVFTFINLYLYQSVKSKHVTEHTRYFIIGYGIVRIILGSTLYGLITMAIGWFTLVNNTKIYKKIKSIVIIILLSILPFVLTNIVVNSLTNPINNEFNNINEPVIIEEENK